MPCITNNTFRSLFDGGRCFPQCIHLVTGIPLDVIPHFCRDHANDEWLPATYRWFQERGFFSVMLSIKESQVMAPMPYGEECIVTVRPSPKSLAHAVVATTRAAKDGRATFDLSFNPYDVAIGPETFVEDVLFVVRRGGPR